MATVFGTPLKEWQMADSKRKGHFELALFEGGQVSLRVFGKGTVEGTKNIIHSFEELFAMVGPGNKVKVLVDMGKMKGVPLRAQALLGRWLVKTRSRVGLAAVFGGRSLEVKVARTVTRVAGLIDKVAFLDSEREAIAFLQGVRS